MLRLVLFLIVALVVASGAAWLVDHPGHVAIDLGGTLVEMRLGTMVLAVGAIALALAILIEIYRWITRAPRRVRNWRDRTRELKGWQELSMGLVAAAAGDPNGLRIHARQAQRLIPHNPAVRVLAAQSAQLEGKEDVAETRYREMLKDPGTELLAIRGLLTNAMQRHRYDEADELLDRARRRNASAPWVIESSFDLFTRTSRWLDAMNVLDDMQRLRMKEPATLHRWRAVLAYLRAAELVDRDRLRDAIREGRKACDLAPDFPMAAILTSDVARRLGKTGEARKVLERAWAARPHPSIARAYGGLIETETPAERLVRCQRLLDLQPNHVQAYLSVAEFAMNAHDWEKARSLLERAIQLEPTARAYRLMAEVERSTSAIRR